MEWLGVSHDVPHAMKMQFQPLKSVLNLRSGVPSRDIKAAEILPFIKSLDALTPDAAAHAQVVSPGSLASGRVRPGSASQVLLPSMLIARHALKKGDVVVTARGDFTAGLIDMTSIDDANGSAILAGPLCHVLSPQDWTQVLPEYLVWLLGTEYAKQHMGAAARGSATALYSLEVIGSLPVPILPKETQEAIAATSSAGLELYLARRAMADAEFESNNKDLCRIAGIIS
jgi:restriction endonuclease S subunit